MTRRERSPGPTPLVRACGRAVALAAFLALACGTQTNNTAAAGVALGATVLATGVYRAATGECWARCQPGFVCDRRRGLCIRAECAPGCPVGTHCVREFDERFVCVDDAGAFPLGNARRPSSGPAVADAGAPNPIDASAPASDAAAGAGPNAR